MEQVHARRHGADAQSLGCLDQGTALEIGEVEHLALAAGQAPQLRRRLRLADTLAHEVVMEPDAPRDPLDRLHAARLAGAVQSLLADLPRRQREVFHLADLEGCPLVEAAERLGMSAVTARVHLFHARRTLRSRLLERWPSLAGEGR